MSLRSSFIPRILSSRPASSSLGSFYYRKFSSSQVVRDEDDGDDEGEDDFDLNFNTSGENEPEDDQKKAPHYKVFMESIGSQYKFASRRQWLAPGKPFPMNPSFRPPPPISNEQRNAMFNLYMSDPMLNGPRQLSRQFNISLNRVDAILRLKGLEKSFIEGIPLQTGFQVGMDNLLGAETHRSVEVREADVTKADFLQEDENRDSSRYRFERLYWESVPEDGREPVLPDVMEVVKQKAEQKKRADELQAGAFLKKRPLSKSMALPKEQTYVVSSNDGLPTKFMDIGSEFLNVEESKKKLAKAQTSQIRRRQKAAKKKSS